MLQFIFLKSLVSSSEVEILILKFRCLRTKPRDSTNLIFQKTLVSSCEIEILVVKIRYLRTPRDTKPTYTIVRVYSVYEGATLKK